MRPDRQAIKRPIQRTKQKIRDTGDRMSGGQKLLLFLLVFAGTAGVLKVDQAYSDMMDQEGMLGLSVRRVDEENLRVSVFGRTEEINAAEVVESWKDVQENVTAALDSAASGVRELLGISGEESGEEEPLQRVVFPVQTL